MRKGQVGNSRNGMLHLVEKSEVEKDFDPRLRIKPKAVLIQKFGNQLHCSIITIAKAQVFFHKFQRLENPEIDTLDLAAACLSLSIRLCHEDVTPEEVILKFYHMEQDLDPISEEEIQNMKTELRVMEFTICCAFKFNIKFKLAYTYLFNFLAQLQSLTDAKRDQFFEISTTVTRLLSAYYLCEGCLDFDAFEIATSCIQYAYLFCCIFTPSVKYIMKKELDSVPNKGRISHILEEMVEVYDAANPI